MIGASAQFLLCSLAIVIAGTFLTRCADRLAVVSGLGRVFVGSLFLAASTLGVMGQVLKPRRRRGFLEPSAELIALLIAGLPYLLYRSRAVPAGFS